MAYRCMWGHGIEADSMARVREYSFHGDFTHVYMVCMGVLKFDVEGSI